MPDIRGSRVLVIGGAGFTGSHKEMTDIIAHRGPDDAGYAFFSINGVTKGKNLWLELTDDEFEHKNVHLAPINSSFAKQ